MKIIMPEEGTRAITSRRGFVALFMRRTYAFRIAIPRRLNVVQFDGMTSDVTGPSPLYRSKPSTSHTAWAFHAPGELRSRARVVGIHLCGQADGAPKAG